MSAGGRDCLDDNEVGAFAAGRVAAEDAAAIHAHLAGCDACRELVAQVARGSGAGAAETLPATPAEIVHERGGKVGRYLMLEPLGRGGMGVVYRAFDPELDRRVALKLVRADRREQAELRLRLVREAQAMARVSHRNVLTVYDAGTVGDEVYIAMALVEGGTLRQWLRAEPRPRRAILERFVAAGRGLEAAHAAGVVHRDFKPDNVLVDQSGHVFVTDFGLARPSLSRDPSAPPSPTSPLAASTLTQPGAVVGTPAFMAPEQLRGDAVDARADQFSFCVALWEALTGRPPFSGATVGERLAAIGAGKPPARGLPAWLARVLGRGLALDPDARWPSMTALLARIEASPTRRRRRALLVAGVLAAVAAVPGAIWWRGHAQLNACRARQHEIDPVWNDARKQALQAAFAASGRAHAGDVYAQVVKLVDDYVTDWKKLKNNSCKTTRIKHKQTEATLAHIDACLDERLAEVDRMTTLFSSVDGPMLNRAVDAVRALPAIKECADGKKLAREEQLPADPELRARVVEVRRKLSAVRALRAAGRYRQAEAEAIPLETEVVALHHAPTEAQYWLLMCAVAGDFRDAARTRDAAHKAILAAESVPLPAVAFTAWHLLFRVAAYAGYGTDADEAEAQMEAWAESSGDESARARLKWDRARRLSDTGHADQAIPLLEESLAIAERDKLAYVDNIVGDLADAYWLAHRFDRARAMYERDIHDAEAAAGPYNVDAAPSLNNLGGLLLDENKVGEAKPLFERALALYRDAYGPEDSRVADELNSLAVVARAQGHPAEGEKLARQATAIFEKALGRDNPRVAYSLTNVGAALVEQRRPAEAVAPLERALAIRAHVECLPSERAETSMYLGFALGDSSRDPRRSRALVSAARADMVTARNDNDVARIDRWLAARK